MHYCYKTFNLIMFITIHASCAETLQEAFLRLLQLDTALHRQSFDGIEDLRLETARVLSLTLNNHLLPGLERASEEFETVIGEIGAKLAPSDGKICVDETNVVRSRIINMTLIISNTIEEKDVVYDKILLLISQIGIGKVDSLHAEIFDIWDDLRNCTAQPRPELCSVQIRGQIMDRIVSLPEQHREVTDETRMQMRDHQLSYETRYQSHVDSMKLNLQPFIALMENCVSNKLLVS